MHPKTFEVRLCRPFGAGTSNPYVFYVHADDRQQALGWVESVFVGIDTRPTLYRWSGGLLPQIGNSDPVSITDCDSYRRTRRVGGGIVRSVAEPGEFRRSSKDVVDDYEKVVAYLGEEHRRIVSSFHGMARDYARQPRSWVYERLVELKCSAERSALWRENMVKHVERVRPALTLDLPPMQHA
jgi:hypothetical protein